MGKKKALGVKTLSWTFEAGSDGNDMKVTSPDGSVVQVKQGVEVETKTKEKVTLVDGDGFVMNIVLPDGSAATITRTIEDDGTMKQVHVCGTVTGSLMLKK